MFGLSIANRRIAGESAAERFAQRAGDKKLQVLLKSISEKIPTHAVIFDVSTDRGIRSGNQTMYGLFLQSLGYAKDLDLSELEIGLEEKGELDRQGRVQEALQEGVGRREGQGRARPQRSEPRPAQPRREHVSDGRFVGEGGQEQGGHHARPGKLARGYLKKLLDNGRVVRFLAQKHKDLLCEFQKIIESESSMHDVDGRATAKRVLGRAVWPSR